MSRSTLHATAFARTIVYALALYGGADLARSVVAQTPPAARAYLPVAVQPTTAQQAGLADRVAALEATLSGVRRQGDDLIFSGVNVYVVSGAGKTDAAPNGKGNLIVGYNELRGGFDLEGRPEDRRGGSHNLVVGSANNYTSWGGVVTGIHNDSEGQYAALLGGHENTAAGDFSAALGGVENAITGDAAVAIGGSRNRSDGYWTLAAGGTENVVQDDWSAVLGGTKHALSPNALYATITGGQSNSVACEACSIAGGASIALDGSRNNAFAAGQLRSP